MHKQPFFNYLLQRVYDPLPGREAQVRMAPKPLNGEISYPDTPAGDFTKSSVMVLLIETDLPSPEIVLTLRTDSINHPGQISFPGGRANNGETPEQTALREMNEEIGVCKEHISIAGTLSDLYLGHSNNLITPVLGGLPFIPDMNPNPYEVREIFKTDLDRLLKDQTMVVETWNLRNTPHKVPYWDIHEVPFWGATAMMTSELLELYKEYLRQNQ